MTIHDGGGKIKANNRRHWDTQVQVTEGKHYQGLRLQKEQMFLPKPVESWSYGRQHSCKRVLVLEEATARWAIPKSRSSSRVTTLSLLLPFYLLPVFHWSNPTGSQRMWSPPLPPHPTYHGLAMIPLNKMVYYIWQELESESYGKNEFTIEFVSMRCLQSTWSWISSR